MKYVVTVTHKDLELKGLSMVSHFIPKFPLHEFKAKPGSMVMISAPKCDLQTGEIVSIEAMKEVANSHADPGLDERYLIVKPIWATVTLNCIVIEAKVIETIRFEKTDLIVDYDARMNAINSLFPECITFRDRKETRNIVSGDIVILHDSNIMGKPILTFEGRKEIRNVPLTGQEKAAEENGPAETYTEDIEESKPENTENYVTAESIPAVDITDPLPSEKEFTPTQMMRDCFPGCAQYIGDQKRQHRPETLPQKLEREYREAKMNESLGRSE